MFRNFLIATLVVCLLGVFGDVASTSAENATVGAGKTTRIIGTISSQELKKFMEEQGYTVTLVGTNNDLLFWMIDGHKTGFIINKNKTVLTFHVGFASKGTNATMSRVNDWNKSVALSRSYLDSDGDPMLELELGLEGGITSDRLGSYLKECRTCLGLWIQQVL